MELYPNFDNEVFTSSFQITQFLQESPNSFEFCPIKPEGFNYPIIPEKRGFPIEIELDIESRFQEEQLAESISRSEFENSSAKRIMKNVSLELPSPASSPVSSRCNSPAEDVEFSDNNTNSTPRRGAVRRTRSHEDGFFINVAPYLHLPQHEAAKNLGIPSSTLSKRWKEATNNRKWPFRVLAKLDKEILTLAQNAFHSQSEKLQSALTLLYEKRKEVVKDIHIRL